MVLFFGINEIDHTTVSSCDHPKGPKKSPWCTASTNQRNNKQREMEENTASHEPGQLCHVSLTLFIALCHLVLYNTLQRYCGCLNVKYGNEPAKFG